MIRPHILCRIITEGDGKEQDSNEKKGQRGYGFGGNQTGA